MLDFFANYKRPTLAWARAQVRKMTSNDENEASAATGSVISIAPVFSERPVWHAGPDLAHAALKGGKNAWWEAHWIDGELRWHDAGA